MKKMIALVLLFIPCLSARDFSMEGKPPTVRVLLTKLAKEAQLEVKGRYYIFDPKSQDLIHADIKGKKSKLTTSEKGLSWGGKFSGHFEMRFVPGDANAHILVNGTPYKGCVEVYSIGGTLNLVNEVDTESYLKSILNIKDFAKSSKETLEALVITERTHLYYLITHDAFASYQVEADEVGYNGIPRNGVREVVEAVERTRDMVMNYKCHPFPASWSPNHAGKSVSYAQIFRKGKRVPPGSKLLPSSHYREASKWKKTISKRPLAEIAGVQTIETIDLFRVRGSSKVYAVRISDGVKRVDVDFPTFQRALGKGKLTSNDFTLKLQKKKVEFTGFGKGMGAGLCLRSAEILSQKRSTVKMILSTHFPGAELLNLREETGAPQTTSHVWK